MTPRTTRSAHVPVARHVANTDRVCELQPATEGHSDAAQHECQSDQQANQLSEPDRRQRTRRLDPTVQGEKKLERPAIDYTSEAATIRPPIQRSSPLPAAMVSGYRVRGTVSTSVAHSRRTTSESESPAGARSLQTEAQSHSCIPQGYRLLELGRSQRPS